jgi:glucosamine--fructose-6-phosphate aminotransferase (isomerizing)
MVEPQYPVLLYAPDGAAQDGMLELQSELRRRGAETYVITDATTRVADATAVVALSRALPEPLSPLASVIPGQLLALHLSLARGLDPDRPRGLTKVTRTR